MQVLKTYRALLRLDNRRRWDRWVVADSRRANPSMSCKLGRSSKLVRCLDETSARTGCRSDLVRRRGNLLSWDRSDW